jgi:transcriptional regulator with XRE-family HTH domain
MSNENKVKEKFRPSRLQVIAARNLLNRMTQEELAKAAGVSNDTISLFETGQTTPQDATLAKIQKALEDRGIIFSNGDKPSVTLDRSQAIIPT